MEPKKEVEKPPVDNGNKPPDSERTNANAIKKLYLVLYNSSLVICWCLVLLKAAVHLSEKKSFVGLYAEVEYWLKVSQTVAICEIFHALFGLVRSSAWNTLTQIMSRVAVLWVFLDMIAMKHDTSKDTIGFPMLLFAWTITEIIRYTFYAHSLLDIVSDNLIWSRYTFFIVLYPLGVAGELICIVASLPIIRDLGLFSVPLANPANISFNFEYFCYFLMLMYIPGFAHLYTYMLSQRRKILGKKEKSS